MKVCTCFLLFGILAHTHSFASNTSKPNQRSVNLAIETVLEFSNKDKEVDINFLNNVQNFITKVKTVIDENGNSNNLRRIFKVPRVKTFTGFIQDVIHILNTYEDTAFADFFGILDEEIRNYHYRGCRFYELTESYEIRKLIAAKLDSIKGKPTSVVKTNINAISDMLKDDNYDRNVKEIVDYIDSLYKQEDGENFQKVIIDLEFYGRSKSKRSNNNLGNIIKNGVRSIIFDHYTNLNTNVRRDVKQKVETFLKKIKKNTPSRGNIPNIKRYSISRNNVKSPENIVNKVKKPEPVSRKDLMIIANNKANKKNRTEVKQSEYKKVEMKRDDVKNEKKRYKHTRKDTVDEPFDTQKKETRPSPLIYQQWTKNEHQKQPNINSLSDESFSSIEFYQELRHNTTQYIAIIPEKIYQTPSTYVTNKPGKIVALDMTTRIPKNNTVKKIWIEESTGRLPKAVLDKLAFKPSGHESRHNMTDESLNNKHSHRLMKKYEKDQKKWHGVVYEPKYVKMYGKKDDKKYDKKRMTNHSENNTSYESRQKQKSNKDKKHKYDKTSEPYDPLILVHNRDFFRQNYVRTTKSVFNMEVHQNTKSKGPLRVELKQNKRWSTASTKAQKFLEVLDVLMPSKSGKTVKSPRARRTAAPRVKLNEIKLMRPTQQTSTLPTNNSSLKRLALGIPRAYSKRNTILSWKPEWHSRKSTEYPSLSNEGMAVETFEIKGDKISHGQNTKKTSSSLEKDPYVIERIKNLERRLTEAKSIININTDMMTAGTHSFRANDNIIKHNQTKTKFRLDINNFLNDNKIRQDKIKMAETVDNRTKHVIENKYVKDEDSTINEIEDDIQKDKKSETKFRADVNMIPNDFKDRAEKTMEAGKPDNKTYVKHKDFKNKEEILVDDSEIEKVTKYQEIIKIEKKPERSLTNISDISPKAKDNGIKAAMNDHDRDDASKETEFQSRKLASLRTSVNVTEYITKTTMNVQPTVEVTTPTTLRSSNISISIPVATSPKLADLLLKAEFNATVDKSKNRMANSTSQVADVTKTTINVTKEVTTELINTSVANLSDVTPTTSKYQEKI